jgi:hypothetical protein
MKLSSWCLLLASAILYAIPLMIPDYAWWIAFLFPIPLFYVATQENLGFKTGFIWGGIAISTHLSGVLLGMDRFTEAGDSWIRIIPALLLIGYSSLCTGVCFWLSARIQHALKLTSPTTIIALWTLTLWCYIFFFDRMCLFPCGRTEGYFGFHPIVALAMHPQLLMLLPIIGKNLLSLALYAVPATITIFLIKRNKLHALLIGIACLPWLISLCIPIPQAQKPEWFDKIVAFPAAFFSMETALMQAEAAQEFYRLIANKNDLYEIILMPESAFNCDKLSADPDLCKQWSQDHIGKPMHIILGSFRQDGPYFRNSLHWIYNGKLEGIFDKRHAMALLERIPPCLNIPTIYDLFHKTRPEINPSTLSRPLFSLSDTIQFTPYICSELFFNEFPDDNHTATILATANDLWCFNLYVAKLMYLDARLKAIMWQRDLVYISFKYAAYFDKYGNEIPITRITNDKID